MKQLALGMDHTSPSITYTDVKRLQATKHSRGTLGLACSAEDPLKYGTCNTLVAPYKPQIAHFGSGREGHQLLELLCCWPSLHLHFLAVDQLVDGC